MREFYKSREEFLDLVLRRAVNPADKSDFRIHPSIEQIGDGSATQVSYKTKFRLHYRGHDMVYVNPRTVDYNDKETKSSVLENEVEIMSGLLTDNKLNVDASGEDIIVTHCWPCFK
jgi:hypothetical protein|tara:strand:- start:26078 stop:26425 length:348 start_codon:yes stop_codon:yes gene_type:complete